MKYNIDKSSSQLSCQISPLYHLFSKQLFDQLFIQITNQLWNQLNSQLSRHLRNLK